MLVVGFFILRYSPTESWLSSVHVSPLDCTVGLWVVWAAYYAYAGDGFLLRARKGLKRVKLIGRLASVTLVIDRDQRTATIRGPYWQHLVAKTVQLSSLSCDTKQLEKTIWIPRRIDATAHTPDGPVTITGTAGMEGSHQVKTGWSRVGIWGITPSEETTQDVTVTLPDAGAQRLAEFIDSEREWVIQADRRDGEVEIADTIRKMIVAAGMSPETTLFHWVRYNGTAVNSFDSLVAADSSSAQVLLWEREHGSWIGDARDTEPQIEGDHLEVHASDHEYRMKYLKERRMPMLRNCSRDVLITWYDRLRILTERG